MKYAFAILAALAFATVANGEAIEVTNASFEAPALDLGGWSNDLAPNGWTQLPETGSAFIEFIDGFSADGNQHQRVNGRIATSKHKSCAVRSTRWRFVNNQQLYDIAADPYGQNDVAPLTRK